MSAAHRRNRVGGVRKCRWCRQPFRSADTGRPRRYCSAACRQAAYRKRTRRLKGSLAVMSSSRSGDWPTDPVVFGAFDARYGPFTLDACASAENAKCERYFTVADDGLSQTWTGRVWVNPPYGRTLPLWIAKAYESAGSTAEIVVCLVPARTDTRWWHEFVVRGEVEFIKGRLKFGPLTSPAPFPSAVVVFRNARARDETLAARALKVAA